MCAADSVFVVADWLVTLALFATCRVNVLASATPTSAAAAKPGGCGDCRHDGLGAVGSFYPDSGHGCSSRGRSSCWTPERDKTFPDWRSLSRLPVDQPEDVSPYPTRQRMSAERQLDPNELGNHIDRLYRAAWGLCGSREDAEDLVQETFAKVLRKPRFLRSEDDIGYLLRVLRNTFFSQRRTAARRPQTAPLPDESDVLEDPRAVRAESRLESSELFALVSTLPADFRDALIAVDLVGLSYRQAARSLRVREATITTRLHRARQRVAKALALDGESDESTGSERRLSP